MQTKQTRDRRFIVVSAAVMGLVACGGGEAKPAGDNMGAGSSGGTGGNPCTMHPMGDGGAPMTQTMSDPTMNPCSTHAMGTGTSGAMAGTTATGSSTAMAAPSSTTTTTTTTTTTNSTARRPPTATQPSGGGMRM